MLSFELYFMNRDSPPLTLPCPGVEIGVDVPDALGDVLENLRVDPFKLSFPRY